MRRFEAASEFLVEILFVLGISEDFACEHQGDAGPGCSLKRKMESFFGTDPAERHGESALRARATGGFHFHTVRDGGQQIATGWALGLLSA